MNVYDFDGTIYNGDSTKDFYLYCLKKNPMLIKFLPIQIYGAVLYIIGIWDKTKFKENFYCFLNGIDSVEDKVADFWKKKADRIFDWYKSNQNIDDIIISASPEFLLIHICAQLNIKHLIASQVNSKNGKYCGKNCYGEEKVKRYNLIFNNLMIDKFYSDSKSDLAMAKISKKSFLVYKGIIKEWDNL